MGGEPGTEGEGYRAGGVKDQGLGRQEGEDYIGSEVGAQRPEAERRWG